MSALRLLAFAFLCLLVTPLWVKLKNPNYTQSEGRGNCSRGADE